MPREAVDLVDAARERVAATTAKVAGKDPKSVLIVLPGMSMMNSNGLPDVLVVGVYQAGEDGRAMAEELFAKFPAWEASRTRTGVTVSDSLYLGPLNAVAVEKLAAAIHG
ncbi:hypothetical protein Amir_3627 [Actinosynnema mirum DSM 43827]|uniref:Uncharacterized protein n=1 Tax=Actinosynnema mirum (strain ATCC 29888 / DSM 43827 / JCM 3225 / NBRC 14064 / NCIMB 13271 / NRRL B-12336 / IMRU 3971 / 101) TaxID=446462 RepID=C6WBU9_ACTMD|nr:hypothetical protein Amir_3627 [Actinosynnema mirum DSM 43827]